MKRSDLDLTTTYAARRSTYGPPIRVRVLDLTTLYTLPRRRNNEPVTFIPTTQTRAQSDWQRTVGLLCADPANPDTQFLIDPRKITGTWEEHLRQEAAEAAARKAAHEQEAAKDALREDQYWKMLSLLETLELPPTQLPLLRLSSSQRVPNEVLLTLLTIAARQLANTATPNA